MTNRPEFKVVEGGAGSMDKMKALEAALSQIEKMHGKGSIMRLGASDQSMDVEAISTGSLGLDIALGIGGLPRGRVIEIYGPESSGKTTLSLQVVAEAQKIGRHLRLRRRRARARSGLRQKARRQGRGPADLAARQRRAGAGDCRHAGALRCRRRAGRRQRRRADAQGRARRRDGRHATRHAGAPDEQGAAQAHRLHLQVGDHGDLHQSDPHEDRRHVRQPGDDDGRQRAEILCLRAPRHPPHRPDQGPRGGRRQPDARQGGQEQGGAAVQAGRVRHHVRRGHLQDGRARRPRGRRSASSRSPAPGSPTTATASARAARTPRRSSRRTRRSPPPSKRPFATTPG